MIQSFFQNLNQIFMKNSILLLGVLVIALGIALSFKSFQSEKVTVFAVVDEGPGTKQKNTILESNASIVVREEKHLKDSITKVVENCFYPSELNYDSVGNFFWMVHPKDFAFVKCGKDVVSIPYKMPDLFLGVLIDDKVFFNDSVKGELFMFQSVVTNDPRQSFLWYGNFPRAYTTASNLTRALEILLGLDVYCSKYKHKVLNDFLWQIKEAELIHVAEEKMSPEDIMTVVMRYSDFYDAQEVRTVEECKAFLYHNSDKLVYME
jgi:hypothetical protein